MNLQVTPAPVRKSVFVATSPEKAFAVFMDRMGSWWPKSHSVGSSPQKDVKVEPKTGGRWYEIGEDGSECNWGRVEAWEPPARALLIWQLDSQWQFNPGLVTEVEVTFTAEGAGTRVVLEHRKLENMGQAADATRAALDSDGGWGGILALYAGLAAA